MKTIKTIFWWTIGLFGIMLLYYNNSSLKTTDKDYILDDSDSVLIPLDTFIHPPLYNPDTTPYKGNWVDPQ